MIQLHTEIYGTGEPMVLIHGWAMHTGIWRSFAQQLAQHYQVIAVDLPGHGHSETLNPFTLESINQALCKILPLEPCTLVGWSLGATVALDLAARFPQRVKKLVILAGNPCFVKNEDWPGVKAVTLEKFAAELQTDCHATLLRFLSLQVKGLANYKTVLKELKTALQACEAPTPEILQSALHILQQQDLRPQLARLSCPVQVILGSHDTLVPVAVAEPMRALAPRLQITVIDKAGHVPFLSHSAHLIALLQE